MNDYDRCVRDCKLSIKAFQNMEVARLTFTRLSALVRSRDHLLLTSLFHTGVIRYAKPFMSADLGDGSIKYPVKHLKSAPGFDVAVHDHLLEVRNTLIAHDDFTQIDPRVMVISMKVHGAEELPIPTSVAVANKCVSHPADAAAMEKMKLHVEAALKGVYEKLYSDIHRLRTTALEKPEQTKASVGYSAEKGSQEIPVGGVQANMPDPLKEPWLEPQEPDFSEIHNGYRYQTCTLRRDFHGPELIKLPNGLTLQLTPNQVVQQPTKP